MKFDDLPVGAYFIYEGDSPAKKEGWTTLFRKVIYLNKTESGVEKQGAEGILNVASGLVFSVSDRDKCLGVCRIMK